MDDTGTDASFGQFFAVRRDAWLRLVGDLKVRGADAELLLDADLIDRRCAALMRIDLRGALLRAAARSLANARLLDAATPAIGADEAANPVV